MPSWEDAHAEDMKNPEFRAAFESEKVLISDYALHRGDDGRVHYARRHDPEMRWLCGKGVGGSVQREDLDAPLCEECASSVARVPSGRQSRNPQSRSPVGLGDASSGAHSDGSGGGE